MIQHYDGQTLFGADGEQLGTIERTFVDDKGLVHYLTVKMGGLFTKHRLVPMDLAEARDDGLRVPYSRGFVEEGPSVDVGEALGPDAIGKVRAYYEARDRDPVRGGTSDTPENGGVTGRLAGVGSELKSAVGSVFHSDHADSTDASTQKAAKAGQEDPREGNGRQGLEANS